MYENVDWRCKKFGGFFFTFYLYSGIATGLSLSPLKAIVLDTTEHIINTVNKEIFFI